MRDWQAEEEASCRCIWQRACRAMERLQVPGSGEWSQGQLRKDCGSRMKRNTVLCVLVAFRRVQMSTRTQVPASPAWRLVQGEGVLPIACSRSTLIVSRAGAPCPSARPQWLFWRRMAPLQQ